MHDKRWYYATGSRNPEYLDILIFTFPISVSLSSTATVLFCYSSNLKKISLGVKVAWRVSESNRVLDAGRVHRVHSGPLSIRSRGWRESREQMPGPELVLNQQLRRSGERDYQISSHTFCLRASILFGMMFNEITRCVKPVSLTFFCTARNLSTTQQTTMNLKSIQPKSSYF